MITWMQKHRKYLVITIWISTIAFIGAGFVGWGQFDLNMDRSKSIAKVGDRVVTIREFQLTYSNIYNYYNRMFKGQLTKEKAKELGIENQVYITLINNALLLNYADELGLLVTDDEVKEALKNNNNFKKEGKFSKEIYYRVLKSIGMKPKEYEESLRKELLLTKLNKFLKTPTTKLEIETIASALTMQDKLEYMIIEKKESDLNISENILKAYWEKHKNNYMTKKSYSLDTVDFYAKDINITDEAKLKDFYQKNRLNYKDKNGKIKSFKLAKREVEQDYKLKKARHQALMSFAKFKKGKIETTSKIVIFDRDENVTQKEIAKIRKAKKGDFIKPIKLKDRYIISKLTSINNPRPMDFEAAREMALQDLKSSLIKKELEKEAKNLLPKFKGEVSDFVSREDSLKGLNRFEAMSFLDFVFKNPYSRGYKILVGSNKAVIYRIIDQKISDKKRLKELEPFIKSNIAKIKSSEINKNLISLLKKKYKIESYYKGE